MKKDNPSSPLFMVAQLPFNVADAVTLNTPMTDIMDDHGNLRVNTANLKELGIWDSLLQSGIRFLEIGCGRGYLLRYLYQKGDGEYYGTEPIISQSKIAFDNLLKLDDDKIDKTSVKKLIKTSLLEKTKFNQQYFDFIYSYHVFEHLENPLVMLDLGKKWLRPGGRMIVTCPNVEGYFPSKNLPAWRCSIKSHRWLPGLSTLCRAMERSGYRVDRYFTYGGYPAKRKWFNSLFNRWVKVTHRGDVMCVMASLAG